MDLITCVGWVESAKPNISGALGFVPQPNLQKSMLFNSHSLCALSSEQFHGCDTSPHLEIDE